jgi:hypothetical protein
MIRFEFDGREYSIGFHHEFNISFCIIYQKVAEKQFEEIGHGRAFLSLKDKNFNKEIGRKISLTRALFNVELDYYGHKGAKGFRTEAWKAYFGRVTSPKRRKIVLNK